MSYTTGLRGSRFPPSPEAVKRCWQPKGTASSTVSCPCGNPIDLESLLHRTTDNPEPPLVDNINDVLDSALVEAGGTVFLLEPCPGDRTNTLADNPLRLRLRSGGLP